MAKKPHTRNSLVTALLERLITSVGMDKNIPKKLGSQGMVEKDKPFLKQFLRPQEDILPKTSARPKSLTDQSGVWRRLASPEPQKFVVSNKDIEDLLTGRKKVTPLGPQVTAGGLGGYVPSMSLDPKGDLYASIYDKWDFDSPNIHPIVGKVLDLIGSPYHVYQRYSMRPEPNTFAGHTIVSGTPQED